MNREMASPGDGELVKYELSEVGSEQLIEGGEG